MGGWSAGFGAFGSISIPMRSSFVPDRGTPTAAKRAAMILQRRALLCPLRINAASRTCPSGAVEAVARGVGPLGLAAKPCQLNRAIKHAYKTYAPVDIEVVRNTDNARLRGRRCIRAGNKTVSTPQPGDVSTRGSRGAKGSASPTFLAKSFRHKASWTVPHGPAVQFRHTALHLHQCL